MRLPGVLTIAVISVVGAPALAQQKGNPAMPCYEALADDARFAALRDKMVLGPTTSSESQRVAKVAERPTREESAVIAQWRVARDECNKLEKPYLATRATEIQATVNQYYANLQAQIRELEAGRLTYGQFETRRYELFLKVNRDVGEIRRTIVPAAPPPHK